jgi:hypothetical protein
MKHYKDIARYCGLIAAMAVLGYAMYAGVRDQKYGVALLAGVIFAAAGSLLQERISGVSKKPGP